MSFNLLRIFKPVAAVATPVFRFGKNLFKLEDCEKMVRDHIEKYDKDKERMQKEITEFRFNYLDRFEKVNENIGKLKDNFNENIDEVKKTINENQRETLMAFSFNNDEMLKRIAESNEKMIDRLYSVNAKAFKK